MLILNVRRPSFNLQSQSSNNALTAPPHLFSCAQCWIGAPYPVPQFPTHPCCLTLLCCGVMSRQDHMLSSPGCRCTCWPHPCFFLREGAVVVHPCFLHCGDALVGHPCFSLPVGKGLGCRPQLAQRAIRLRLLLRLRRPPCRRWTSPPRRSPRQYLLYRSRAASERSAAHAATRLCFALSS